MKENLIQTDPDVLITIDSISYRIKESRTDRWVSFTVGDALPDGTIYTSELHQIMIEGYQIGAQYAKETERNVKDYRTSAEKTHQAALENIELAPSAEDEWFDANEPDAKPKRSNKSMRNHLSGIKDAIKNLSADERRVLRECAKEKKTSYAKIGKKIKKSPATVFRMERTAVAAVAQSVGDYSDDELKIIFDEWSKR